MKQNCSKSTSSRINLQIRQRLREGCYLILMAVALFALLSLFTYSPNDPAWTNTGVSKKIMNGGGQIGSFFADILLNFFGLVAYLIPLFFLLFAILRMRKKEVVHLQGEWILKSIGFVLLILSSTSLTTLLLHTKKMLLLPGGILGEFFSYYLLSVLNISGSLLLLMTILMCAITLFFGLSWFGMVDYVGERVVRCIKLTFHHVKNKLNHVKKSNTVTIKPNVLAEPRLIMNKEELKVIAPSSRIKENSEVIKPLLTTRKKEVAPISTIVLKEGTLPPLSLLNPIAENNVQAFTKNSLEELSRLVEQRLLDFGVDVKVVAVHPGPIITRFELELAPGVKVSKISSLAKDIARSLSTISVRIVEVIPGKSVIGLELPNEQHEPIFLRELLESQRYIQARSSVSLALGKDINGAPIVVDLAKMPHLLVAGTTGSGKSVSINAMLLSMLFKASPIELRLILIDPKMLELSIYEGIPHLLTPVITDMKDAANALRWCVAEMDRRYKLMAFLGVRNLTSYNQKIVDAIKQKNPISPPPWLATEENTQKALEPLSFIVVVIDELADMMMVVGKKVEDLIARLAQKARASGIHLILATQRPSVDVITGLIKANIPTRIAFQVSSRIDSRTILDQQGAEQLLGNGDMLYLPPGTGMPVRVHGAFIADDEVHRVVAAWQTYGKPDYLMQVVDASNDTSEVNLGEQDPLYDEALKIVTETRRASISLVQRKLKIGYNRAARIMEDMEAAGVVSAMDTNGTREVLAPPPIEM